jgi:hypothetical protein
MARRGHWHPQMGGSLLRDSYQRLFEKDWFSKEQFFEFGLDETIYVPADRAAEQWELLKIRVFENKPVVIRGFGRDAAGTGLFQDLYKVVLGNQNVTKDATNNLAPSKLLAEWTGYSKTKSAMREPIRNYQISHVFGRTKNALAFTAPWNIVYTPKVLDPFTGHEAKGEYVDEYQSLFKSRAYTRFAGLIEDFNQLMSDNGLHERMESYFEALAHSGRMDEKLLTRFKKAAFEEFSPVEIDESGS